MKYFIFCSFFQLHFKVTGRKGTFKGQCIWGVVSTTRISTGLIQAGEGAFSLLREEMDGDVISILEHICGDD